MWRDLNIPEDSRRVGFLVMCFSVPWFFLAIGGMSGYSPNILPAGSPTLTPGHHPCVHTHPLAKCTAPLGFTSPLRFEMIPAP